MNRRGFFGQMAALTAMARGCVPLQIRGLAGWLPARDVLGENFFGLDRQVMPTWKTDAGKYQFVLTREIFADAIARMHEEYK